MATAVLHPDLQRFPAGQSVTARLRSAWPPTLQDAPVGTPGAAVATASVQTDGSLTFTGLADNERYIAHANVGSVDRYFQFSTLTAAAGGGGGTAALTTFEPAGSIAADNLQDALEEVAAEAGGAGAADASTSVKGITKLATAPVSASDPIAVGDNDLRVGRNVQGVATTNLGTAQTVDFASKAQEIDLTGVLNGNLAVTVNNPVAGSLLRVVALQDGTGSRTLTVAGQAVTIPSTPSTGLAFVIVVWTDATHFFVNSAGVESDPLAVVKTLADAKGDLIAASAADTFARLAAGTDGFALVADAAQSSGLKYAARSQVQTFTKTGTLAIGSQAPRFRLPIAAVIESVAITVGTAPTGAALIVDVNKNGTTIFTTQGDRPEIAISGFASADEVPQVTALAVGDYLTVDIDQVGSTVAGADLVVAVRYRLAV